MQRCIRHVPPDALFQAFNPLIVSQREEHDEVIRLDLADGERSHLIRATALDYACVLTHSFHDGRVADLLAGLDNPETYVARRDRERSCG